MPVAPFNCRISADYHTKELDWTSAINDPEGLLPTILANPLQLVDLNQLPEDQLASHQWLYAFALTMKHIRDPQLPTQNKRLKNGQ